jgi:hypothetical protein
MYDEAGPPCAEIAPDHSPIMSTAPTTAAHIDTTDIRLFIYSSRQTPSSHGVALREGNPGAMRVRASGQPILRAHKIAKAATSNVSFENVFGGLG